jgi:hypothetical protein
MKDKLLVVSVAVSVLVSVVALGAEVSGRSPGGAPVTETGVPLNVVTEDSVTRIYSFKDEGHLCFVASTRGGSGVSITCPR